MIKETFIPIVYLRENRPFCLKVRLFLLEADLVGEVEIREFAAGSEEEEEVRMELQANLGKACFPAAKIGPEDYMTGSDDIIAFLAAYSGREPMKMPVLRSYIEGALKPMLRLSKENMELNTHAL